MPADLLNTIAEVRRRVRAARAQGGTISLVPTMGALHAGHGALIDAARRGSDCVVVSIFVNPIQFDRPDDYEAYRIDLAADVGFCAARGADLVFAPSAPEIYPEPQKTFVEVTELGDHLCGKFRPGHFRGVVTVVAKLFHIVEPDRAFFGEKDAQQLAIIRRMTADLNMPIEIVPVPIVREPDGLALSSRNRRLSPEERAIAPALFRALGLARDRIASRAASVGEARQAGLDALAKYPLIRVEYFEVVDPATMTPVDRIAGPVRIAAAVWLGSTRLIDNVSSAPPGKI
jgi:pantoate--beta-alanine ligase